MRRSVTLATIVGLLGLLIATSAQAGPPRGSSNAGRGASSFGSSFSGGTRGFSAQRFPRTQPTYQQRSTQSNRSSFPSPSSSGATGYRDRDWALQRQRNNQQRNLDQRLGRADHLRELSERNGNGRLAETADRIQIRAQQQYDRRTQQIDRFGPPPLANGAQQYQNPQNIRGATPPAWARAPRNTTGRPPLARSPLTPGPNADRPFAVGSASTKKPKPSWNERFKQWWPFSRKR